MKIIKQLTINGIDTKLISDEVSLELSNPGRAKFIVRSDKLLNGVVQFTVGWQGTASYRFFVGYIDRQITVNPQQQMLFCRELSAALNRPIPLGLRHVTLPDVLAAISKKTELAMITSDADYTKKQVSHFHHVGGGYQAMDAIGRVFRVPRYIWQQQGDGSVYAGSWKNSRWPSRRVQIPDKLFTDHLSFNSARLMMIPGLRPGVQFNRGIINTLTCSNDTMVISWKPLKEL